MREARLAKATITELQRQLEEERRKQMETRYNVQLSQELVGAMRLLTEKVNTAQYCTPVSVGYD